LVAAITIAIPEALSGALVMRRLEEAGFQISQRFDKIGKAPDETVHSLVLVNTSILVDNIACANLSGATCEPADLIVNGPTTPVASFHSESRALRSLVFEEWDWLVEIETAHNGHADVRLAVRGSLQTLPGADRITDFPIHTGS
jgi:hypothetical protein